MANAHFFAVSLMATICPLPFGDSLLLDPNDPMYEKQVARNSQPFGYLPAIKPGLTEEAEIINGRLAMLGIISLVFATAVEQKPMLDVSTFVDLFVYWTIHNTDLIFLTPPPSFRSFYC
jgi:hypothetical protein